jgi:2-C-methyl-D-erythritol 4-phosphate cytidylyltransferase
MTESYWVIVPAAGVGSRMGTGTPKQYLPLSGLSILDQTIKRLFMHPKIQGIALGLSESDPFWQDSVWYQDARIVTFVGGDERCDTVLKGLNALMPHQSDRDFVLVHDAARPLVTLAELDALLEDRCEHGALLAIPAKDTIKQACEERSCFVSQTLDRNRIWQAQTPQKFPAGELKRALELAQNTGFLVTDESSAMERLGVSPALVDGSPSNIKVTYPIDLVMAEAIMAHFEQIENDIT